MTIHQTRRVAPLVGGALAVLLLAACTAAAAAPSGVATLQSGSPDPSAAAASPSSSLSPEDAAVAFARCMREHGIPMDDPKVDGAGGPIAISIGGPGIDKADLQEAQEACGGFMGVSGPKGTMPPEMLDQLVAYASCMREHGIDFPDPQVDGGGILIGGDKDTLDPSSDEFQAANDACKSKLPGGGKDGGPGFQIGPGGGGDGGTTTNGATGG